MDQEERCICKDNDKAIFRFRLRKPDFFQLFQISDSGSKSVLGNVNRS